MDIVLTGTGSPIPDPNRAGPSTLVKVGELEHILIDAGSDKAALFVEEFQRKTFMEWTYQGNLLGRFTLRGSRKAFDEVIRCQRSYNEAKASQSDPFSTKKNDPFAD